MSSPSSTSPFVPAPVVVHRPVWPARVTVWALGATAGALLIAMSSTLVTSFVVESETWDPLYLITLSALAVALLTWATAAGAWIWWQFQMQTFIERQSSAQLRFGRHSVWWWLVPAANLVVSPLAVRQLSAATRSDERPASVTLVWWVGWVLTALSLALVLIFGGTNRILLLVPTAGIAAVTAFLAALVVSSINNSSQHGIDQSTVTDRMGPQHLIIATVISAFLVALGSTSIFLFVEWSSNGLPTFGSQPSFELGTCFNEPFFEDPYEVDCGDPHDAEVHAVLAYPAEGYPGDDVLWEWANGRCLVEFERTTGQEWIDSELDYWWFYPSETSWDDGDRAVQCYLVHLSGSKLVGSMLTDSDEPVA